MARDDDVEDEFDAKPPRRRRAQDILSRKQYQSYRHGRLLALLLAIFALKFTLLSFTYALICLLTDGMPHPAVGIVATLIGLAGVIGSIAARRGSRRWAWLTYLFAAVFVFGCPCGTIISALWVITISRYLATVDKVRLARAADAERDDAR